MFTARTVDYIKIQVVVLWGVTPLFDVVGYLVTI
jgi:hypothetical protein